MLNRILQKNWSLFWFYGIVCINVFLIVVTFFKSELTKSTESLGYLLYRLFTLTNENNFAAWWSGSLLLLAGLHAFDGYVLKRNYEPNAAKGWAALAFILLILSADEIGSLHERVSNFFPDHSWLALLPFAIFLLACLFYAIVSLRSAKEQAGRVWAIILGFCIFGSVAFQEFLEHNIHWSSEMLRFRSVVEEGSELFGMMILLKVCMSNTQGLFSQKGERPSPTLDAICLLRYPLLIIGIILAPVIAYVTAILPEQDRGHPAEWFAAVLFCFAAGASFKRFLEGNENISWYSWGLTTLCLGASAVAVAIPPTPAWINLKLSVFFILIFAICAILIFGSKIKMRLYILFISIIGGFAVLAFLFPMNLFFVFGISQYLGIMVYYANSSRIC